MHFSDSLHLDTTKFLCYIYWSKFPVTQTTALVMWIRQPRSSLTPGTGPDWQNTGPPLKSSRGPIRPYWTTIPEVQANIQSTCVLLNFITFCYS